MNKKYYCLREYGYLYSREFTTITDNSNMLIEKKEFDEIEKYLLQNFSDNQGSATQFLVPGYKKGIGKILKAQNYVGLVNIKNHIVIEILPKLYDSNNTMTYEKTIKIFLKMLKTLEDSPFKNHNISNIDTSNMKLLHIFINMFLQELGILMKKGIKSGYVVEQENTNFYKGKLLVKNHIIKNIVHKEKFYIEHDNFIRNISENRIIKTTLFYLKSITENYKTQRMIREYLFQMDDIEVSNDIDKDLSKCNSNRTLSDYDVILNWCRIFLKKRSFTNYKGCTNAYSLLFPMEKVFESYVAKCIKDSEYFRGFTIKTQDTKYHLIESPKRFSLRPDIVIEKDDEIFILDTKWKLLNSIEAVNYGISQSDLYQMYAYAKKYDSHNIFLIYPLHDSALELQKDIVFNYDYNLKLNIIFMNLENMDESLKCLKERIFRA